MLDSILNFKNKIFPTFKQVFGFNADSEVRADKLPVFPEWFFSARIGQPRRINIQEVRTFAKSPWVQMVLNTIKKEITSMDWDISVIDEESEEDMKDKIEIATKFLKKINSENETILNLCSSGITDVGEIDSAAWAKVFSVGSYDLKEDPIIDDLGRENGTETRLVLKPFGQRELVEVRPVDGASMLKQIDIYRRLQAYYQYSFKNPRQNPIRFEKDEIIYFVMNERSYELYGFSPVQAIQQVLEVLIQSTRWNKDFFKNNAIPDGIISLPGADKDSMEKFKRMWENEFKGKPHKLLYHNTAATFSSFVQSSRDMEWLQGQKWFFHLVFAMFGVSPAEAGFYEDVNRSAQEGQERVTVKNAIKPHLKLFENKINTEILPELFQEEEPGIRFQYRPKDHVKEKLEFDQSMQELTQGALTINEYRKMKGMNPVDWGDEPKTNFGFNTPTPNNVPFPDKNPKENQDKSYLSSVFKGIIDPGEDIIGEAKDYSDFLTKQIKKWQEKIINAVDGLETSKMLHPLNKTLGDFLQRLMNGINSLAFLGAIRKYIKADLIAGLRSTEEELGVDIGFTEAYQDKLKKLEQQQIEGYMINGEKWHGLKGVTKELQKDILISVQDGIHKNKSIPEIKKDIKDIFQGATMNRADIIARTETNRFISESKLLAYKESGISGKKGISVALDNRTSDICKRMHAKYGNNPIPLDEPFIDPDTLKEYQNPPFHCRCRSSLFFSPD